MSVRKGQAHRRWWLWLPLLAAVSWFALFGDRSPAMDAAASATAPAVVPARPAATARALPAPAPAASDAALALVPRDQLFAAPDAATQDKTPSRDLFSVRSWTPPPPPAPATVAVPVAPPLPYTFVGKKFETDAWEVYLARGEQTFVARAGQVLEGQWRVDRISPPGLELTYLPLGQALSLSIGETR